MNETDEPVGRPLRLDDDAESAEPDLPAFLARPAHASVYHGFPILDDVNVDGFRLGMITDWEAEPADAGDAFVVAPDGSRCGLVWDVSAEGCFEQSLAPDADRWGVWYVTFPEPMSSRENAPDENRADLQRDADDFRDRTGFTNTALSGRRSGEPRP